MLRDSSELQCPVCIVSLALIMLELREMMQENVGSLDTALVVGNNMASASVCETRTG